MTREQTNIDDLMWLKRIKSDSELAMKMGMSPQSFYSRFKGEITMNSLELIANFFKVSLADVITKSDKFKFVQLNRDVQNG